MLFRLFEHGQSVDVAAEFQVGDDDVNLLIANYLQGVFAAVDGDCLGAELLERLGDSVGVVTLIVNDQDYTCFLLQTNTSLGPNRQFYHK